MAENGAIIWANGVNASVACGKWALHNKILYVVRIHFQIQKNDMDYLPEGCCIVFNFIVLSGCGTYTKKA